MGEHSDSGDEAAWYERWFDTEAYELVYRERDETDAVPLVDLVEELAAPDPGAHILDVGCGRGRHARILARRGYRVTGIDIAERALAIARRRAKEEGLDVRFLRRDMREPIGEAGYEGAVNLFTSFGYFETDGEHRTALGRIADALVEEGWFVQDFLNPAQVREHLIPRDSRVENGVRIEQRRWIEDGRLNKEIVLRRDGEDEERHSYVESVRLLELEDFRRMYREVGLRLLETRGAYDGRPYEAATSPRLILCARRDA